MTRAILRNFSVTLWLCVTASLIGWALAGYSLALCVLAALPPLVPVRAMLRGNRYTYAWSSLLAIPYAVFCVTELLANPRAKWIAAASLLGLFAWFCSSVLYLRVSRA